MTLRLFSTLSVFSSILVFQMAPGALAGPPGAPPIGREETQIISLLHTNDIHSHYRSDVHAPYLGGAARLKTLIDRLRAESSASLLVDGGDWTEGQLYYYLGAGVESYKMMDRMGYDVAVIGNHDWLNGADILLKVIRESGMRTTPVAANIDYRNYRQEKEFKERIPQFTIREIAGAKIAFFGLLTYEFIYDTFLDPMKITSPFETAKKLSEHLKKDLGVDYVVAISHNSLPVNRKVLEVAPLLDLIVGAHDHKKVVRPIVVQRQGAQPGWLVETGFWGRYLGRVQLKVTRNTAIPGKVRVEPVSGELIPVDDRIAEDPEISRVVDSLEGRLEQKYGPIFHDHVADSETDFERLGPESEIGDLMADALREAVGSDLALDHQRFIYSSIAAGTLRTADIYNAAPAVYSPVTDKSWTIQTLSLKGSTLQFLFNLLLTPQKFADGNEPSFSGMKIVYDSPVRTAAPSLMDSNDFRIFARAIGSFMGSPVIKSMLIGGEPVDPARMYKTAFSGGMHETMIVLNQLIPGIIPVKEIKDTGIEAKEALKKYIIQNSPVSTLKLDFGRRAQPVRSDIGIRPAEVRAQFLRQTGNVATLKVTFKAWNFGSTASVEQAGAVKIQGHAGNTDPLVDIKPRDLVPPLAIRALEPGEGQDFEATVEVAADRGPVPVLVTILPVGDEVNLTNNEWVIWFGATRH